jgi:hypothetical protein
LLGITLKYVAWVKDGKLLYKDDDDGWGSYVGEVDQRGKRNGYGKMMFDNDSYYEGGFVNNKYEGDKCIYHWSNGNESYTGGFKDGVLHGVGIFHFKADGCVAYVTSEMGLIVDSVNWSAHGKKTYGATLDHEGMLVLAEIRHSGRRADEQVIQNMFTEISLYKAKKLAKKVYKLPVPEHISLTSEEKAMDFGKAVAEHTATHLVVNGILEGVKWFLGA